MKHVLRYKIRTGSNRQLSSLHQVQAQVYDKNTVSLEQNTLKYLCFMALRWQFI